jgi:nitrogen-specific signal transduction histidine kinase
VTLDIAPSPSPGDAGDVHALNIVRGGVGFDLPIAAYIIAAHHGQVAEHSTAGRLMSFSLWLPLQPHGHAAPEHRG